MVAKLTFLLPIILVFLGLSSTGYSGVLYEDAVRLTIPLQRGFPIESVVRDADGPLTGVTIREKGTNNSVVSDNNGHFQIVAAGGNAVLMFSHVGYLETEMMTGGRNLLEITLVQDAEQLSGVIITALGINRDKKALGYSVEEISGDKLTMSPEENVLNALAGKVSGVTISQTGGTGSSVSMVIRGATSLSSDNPPLFVVDGVPVSNTLNNVAEVGDRNRVDFGNAISSINPDDIASLTILKGSSAAALYGSRAGNGVVLITTKNGSAVNRLTGYPVLLGNPGYTIAPELPVRFYYPKAEQNLNSANEKAAAGRLETTQYSGFGADGAQNSPWSKMWVIRGTGKPW